MADEITTKQKRKAEECPWYLLATLYGVPEPDDNARQIKNREAWNRYMASSLSNDRRSYLQTERGYAPMEVEALSPSKLDDIKSEFYRRRGTSAIAFPQDDEQVDFSDVEFDKPFDARYFLFARNAVFDRATFPFNGYFDQATFFGLANFEGVQFGGIASFNKTSFEGARFNYSIFRGDLRFSGAIFRGNAEFVKAEILEQASFRMTYFQSYVNFMMATFFHTAGFRTARFQGFAIFDQTKFLKGAFFDDTTFFSETKFINSEFRSVASFKNAEFRDRTHFDKACFTEPPQFPGTKLHQDTSWDGIEWPSKPQDRDRAKRFISAYECLKLEMDRLKKHQDEHDFFALEFQSRRVLAGRWKGLPIALYGCFSDYGRSYMRPILGLTATIAAGALLFLPHFGVGKYEKAVGASVASTFGVLGFRKDFISADTIASFSNALAVVSGLQTVVGAILLFLFGLALRNRFRMR